MFTNLFVVENEVSASIKIDRLAWIKGVIGKNFESFPAFLDKVYPDIETSYQGMLMLNHGTLFVYRVSLRDDKFHWSHFDYMYVWTDNNSNYVQGSHILLGMGELMNFSDLLYNCLLRAANLGIDKVMADA